jgi:hypothetical protein
MLPLLFFFCKKSHKLNYNVNFNFINFILTTKKNKFQLEIMIQNLIIGLKNGHENGVKTRYSYSAAIDVGIH